MLVPRRPGVGEIIDLDEVEQAQLMTEIARVARALKAVTACDKLNIAALGNVVPQLHVHVIARRQGDAGLAAAGVGRGAAVALRPRRAATASSTALRDEICDQLTAHVAPLPPGMRASHAPPEQLHVPSPRSRPQAAPRLYRKA